MRFFKLFLKLLALTAAAGILIAAIIICQAKACFKGGNGYSFFVGDTSKNCREVRVEGNATLTKLTLSNVCGEAVEYTELDVDDYLKSVNGKIAFVEVLSDSVNYYCTADLPYSVILYGERINLHICVKKEGVKVASPIIFGGY